MVLNKINSPEDLKQLEINEMKILANQMREAIINKVNTIGGHMGPNLGIVETTRYGIILYSVYLVSIGNIEIGTILLIYSYYAKILTNFEVLGTITADYQSFIVSLRRLNKITALSAETVDKQK